MKNMANECKEVSVGEAISNVIPEIVRPVMLVRARDKTSPSRGATSVLQKVSSSPDIVKPAIDHALQRGIYLFDRAARRRAYSFVQRQLLTDMPYDCLCQRSEIDVIPSRLEGYEHPLLSPYNSVARWSL